MCPTGSEPPRADVWPLIRRFAGSAGERRRQPFRLLVEGHTVSVRFDTGARGWRASGELPWGVCQQLDLYVPLCTAPHEPFTLGHLGQSLDGFIAGADGQSRSLNGPENIVHLHRLRALFDVVLVGRSTATNDDPLLTTRLVEGSHAVRVVLDPLLRCDPGLRLFNDDATRTLVVCAEDAPARDFGASTQVLRAKAAHDCLKLADVLAVLRAEGLQRIFIEGGGRTVSTALQEGVLDRLHVTVAPLFVGSGIRGVTLPHVTRFADALRPRGQRFDMGNDVLFDFDLRAGQE